MNISFRADFMNISFPLLEPPKKKRKASFSIQRWSQEEIDELKILFSEEFLSGKCPRQKAVEAAKARSKINGGVIWKRKWDTIKKKVHYLQNQG
jgi:hypothetical protein